MNYFSQLEPRTKKSLIGVAVALMVIGVGLLVWTVSRVNRQVSTVSVALTQTAEAQSAATQTAAVQTPLTDTVEATPTTTPIPVADSGQCINNATFVADITIPNGALVNPSESFTKIWRIRNSGTCPWRSGYQMVFAGGSRMDGDDRIPIGREVAPGEEYDFAVALTAPAAPGRYQGQWIPADANGNLFGQIFYYEVLVAGTPQIYYFAASSYYVLPGQEVVLSWHIAPATSGFLRADGIESGVPATGSRAVRPAQTTVYELVARSERGETSRALTIIVLPPNPTPTPTPQPGQLPVIYYFRADRYEIDPGQQAILSWDLSGAANGAFLIVNGREEGIGTPGVRAVSPATTSVYRLVARNNTGEPRARGDNCGAPRPGHCDADSAAHSNTDCAADCDIDPANGYTCSAGSDTASTHGDTNSADRYANPANEHGYSANRYTASYSDAGTYSAGDRYSECRTGCGPRPADD